MRDLTWAKHDLLLISYLIHHLPCLMCQQSLTNWRRGCVKYVSMRLASIHFTTQSVRYYLEILSHLSPNFWIRFYRISGLTFTFEYFGSMNKKIW